MTRTLGAPTVVLTAWTAVTCWLVLSSWSRLMEDAAGLSGLLVVTIALVAGTGVGLRRLGLAWPVVFCGQLLVATLVVQAQLGSSWLPTTSSLRVAVSAVLDAVASAEKNVAPVSADEPSIMPLLLVGAVAIHLVVDLVAVSLRRIVAASLPLLAAWVLPVSVLGTAAGWPLFVLAAAAWLALLAADQSAERARWGRVVAAPWFAAVSPGRTALLIGGAALLCAVLLPSALPHRAVVTVPGTGPGGGATVELSDPIADLQRNLTRGDDVGLMQVTVPNGSGAPTYVRLSVLDRYDGDTWHVGARAWPPGNATLGTWPRVPALDLPGVDVPWQARISNAFRSTWLPTPRWAREVLAGEDWRFDSEHHDVHRAGGPGTTAGLSYSAVEFRPELDPANLARAPRDPELVDTYGTPLPDGPSWLGELAREITRGAANDYERAVALQEHFQRNYRYSTDTAPGTGVEALRTFLTEEEGRVGYCEQFAASMALLARELGLPTRVSVGFLRPARLSSTTFEFSAHDLHAWPEVWFSGVGWVGFEPTPTSHTGSVPAWSRGVAEPRPSSSASPTTTPSTSPRPERPEPRTTPEASADSGLDWRLPVAGGGALLLLALAACAPRVLRASQRRRRLASDDVEAWWSELRATALDLGLAWPEGRSPRATARVVASDVAPSSDPEARRALRRLVTAVEHDRYAATGTTDARREDVEAVLTALRAGSTPRVVRRARWWPRSVLRS
jgi:transglutaminase-like putative cysteine protease